VGVLTVIFGAGASYDSVPSLWPHRGIRDDYRPPLANELFGDRDHFSKAIDQLQTIQPIIPRLRHIGDKSVEAVLMQIQAEARRNPERSRQLMAVRYYIQNVLSVCQQGWQLNAHGVTNYKTLLDDILQWREPDEAVCLITFNYDTILDEALVSFGQPLDDLGDYISGRAGFRLFKLHGSVNWVRVLETPRPLLNEDLTPWGVARRNIDRATEVKFTTTFVKMNQVPPGMLNNLATVPAIAIPVEQKAFFECPDQHLLELERLLPETDRLLLVGWRGMEKHFLTMLGKHVKKADACLIVAKDEKEGREVASRVGPALPGVPIRWEFSNGGFSEMIVTRAATKLLSRGHVA
jgi:hypothetical protein